MVKQKTEIPDEIKFEILSAFDDLRSDSAS
jgi:hypothetical protein